MSVSTTSPTDHRIGKLLSDMGLASVEDVEKALSSTAAAEMPIGSLIVMRGGLSERELRTVVQAQSMIKDGIVSGEQAIKAVKLLRSHHSTLESALKQIRWVRDNSVESNTLGELLKAALLVNALNLTKALAISRSTILPLGRVLVLIGAVTEPSLRMALDVQNELRRRSVTRKQGVQKLRSAVERLRGVESTLFTRSGKQFQRADYPRRLGELLVEADVLPQADILTALEMALSMDKQLGEVLLDFSWITEEFLESALNVQQLLGYNVVTSEWAVRQLSKLHSNEIAQINPHGDNVVSKNSISREEFFRVTGLMSGDDVTETVPETLKIADQLHSNIQQGTIRLDQAIVALNFCQRGHMNLREAFAQLGCTISVRTN